MAKIDVQFLNKPAGNRRPVRRLRTYLVTVQPYGRQFTCEQRFRADSEDNAAAQAVAKFGAGYVAVKLVEVA